MKKLAIVTATRAEYGLLHPLIVQLGKEPDFDVQLLVTGTHLSEQYGATVSEIERDGLPIFRRLPILEPGNTSYDITITMANAAVRFGGYFQEEKPDLLIVLGDRTELLGICAAALNEHIPIAHIHGGELTEGAVDDCVRHAVTKLSYLHFPAAEEYRRRIIQMGEAPERVFCVGALGVENILHTALMTKQEVCDRIGIPMEQSYAVVTFHPVTMQPDQVEAQVQELIYAMQEHGQYFYLITKANADAGGALVNEIFADAEKQHSNIKLVSSLGMKRYLSAVKYARFVLGNSSSGIIEAPALGTPTVNIGDRQKGRLMADTVICCEPEADKISESMQRAVEMEHRASTLFGDGTTSKQITDIIKQFIDKMDKNWTKSFYDLEF